MELQSETTMITGGMTMNTHERCRSIEDLPLVLTIEDLMSILDIGRNSAYRLIRENQIRSIRIGTSIRIPRSALVEYFSGPTE